MVKVFFDTTTSASLESLLTDAIRLVGTDIMDARCLRPITNDEVDNVCGELISFYQNFEDKHYLVEFYADMLSGALVDKVKSLIDKQIEERDSFYAFDAEIIVHTRISTVGTDADEARRHAFENINNAQILQDIASHTDLPYKMTVTLSNGQEVCDSTAANVTIIPELR